MGSKSSTVAATGASDQRTIEELLSGINALCDSQKRNSPWKNAACHLFRRCKELHDSFKQHKKRWCRCRRKARCRAAVHRCFGHVMNVMQGFSGQGWLYLLAHQADLEIEIKKCDAEISGCFVLFIPSSQKNTPLHQNEEDEKRTLEESLDADRNTVIEQFTASDFMQLVAQNGPTKDDNDVLKEISKIMQTHLKECKIETHGHSNLEKNLYKLLQSYNQVPSECYLSPTLIEWSGEASIKGKFLHSGNVKIKVVRSANVMSDESIKRLRRQFEQWQKIHETDRGVHIIPFYGFYSFDGVRLALVRPWMDNGNALAYVKKNDRHVKYKGLIIGIAEGIEALHSMNPPIIHGDLRGKKILIGPQDQPLITDYTLAEFDGDLRPQTLGTLDSCRWHAPELFEQQSRVSTGSDIYSLGMTVLELLTHEKPYSSIKELLPVYSKKQQTRGLPDRPQSKRVIKRGLNDTMWDFLCRCWSREPAGRPHIGDVIRCLRSLFTDEGPEEDENEEMDNDTPVDKEGSPLQSLLTNLVSQLRTKGMKKDQDILDLLRQLLDSRDYGNIVSEVRNPSDAELLIEYVLYLLRHNVLSNSGFEHTRARDLMFKLIRKTNSMPKFLFITGVKTKSDSSREHKGKPVTLKVIHKAHKHDRLREGLYRAILAWRSLAHDYIHDLLGLFEERSQLFLVSPLTASGTLTQWRKNLQASDSTTEIHKLMRQVAEAIHFIHTQGVVHGDLCGDHIFLDRTLDRTLRCHIGDFGLSRSSEAAQTSKPSSAHYDAPELYGMCPICAKPDCKGRHDGNDGQNESDTTKSDVYAFGILYYAIYFDNVPFQGKNSIQLMTLVTRGRRPERLETPRMEDKTWNLIQSCWTAKPAERPTMQNVVGHL